MYKQKQQINPIIEDTKHIVEKTQKSIEVFVLPSVEPILHHTSSFTKFNF